MTQLLVASYLVAAAIAARWSFHNGNHREAASLTARILGSVVAGLVWPAIVVELWLFDPDDARRRNRRR